LNLISAGIDIGTTTTRVALSRITITDAAPAFRLPDMRITHKQLLYRGQVHLTPKAGGEVDGRALSVLIEGDYAKAGFNAAEIDTGAVIFTGEAARSRNAPEVADMLARLAGGFVVAAAGADMEGVLAAKGSGAAELSRGRCLLHTDIGGGTSNICLLIDGEAADTGCLDIGGRLIKYVDGTKRIEYISPSIRRLNLGIAEDDTLSAAQETAIAEVMADILAQALYMKPQTDQYTTLLADHGISQPPANCVCTFSGGVAELLYSGQDANFDDIGPALARAIARNPLFSLTLRPKETGGATVTGAADFTMELSGSTIHADTWNFPLRGLQAAAVRLNSREDIASLSVALEVASRRCTGHCAFAFEGIPGAGFADIEAIADAVISALNKEIILIVRRDMAKALGQALSRRTPQRVLCLDGLSVKDGDFIDIGKPVGGVFPVIVHTLLFGR
jgi:ethanolamine utilization protein EutA